MVVFKNVLVVFGSVDEFGLNPQVWGYNTNPTGIGNE